ALRPDSGAVSQDVAWNTESKSAVFAELVNSPLDRRSTIIRGYLESRVQQVLRSREPIVDAQSILDLGMDSLMIVEVLNDCRQDLRIALYPREIYALPNFGALTAYLAREFERAHSGVVVEKDEPATQPTLLKEPGTPARVMSKRNQ